MPSPYATILPLVTSPLALYNEIVAHVLSLLNIHTVIAFNR
jgi:hypothetical protein